MKKAVFLGAAAAALLATGTAYADSGYVGAVYANADVDGLDSSDAYGVEFAAALGEDSLTIEIDGAILDGDGNTATTIGGHVYTRNESHLFGGFASFADNSEADWSYSAGVEGNLYMSNFTLAGALAYVGSNEDDVDGYGLNAEARYFVTENFRIQGELGFADVDSVNGTTFGASAEYKFGSSPVSAAIGYSHSEIDDLDLEADTFTIGLRYNWGGSLLDRDRHGASQASLTNFGAF